MRINKFKSFCLSFEIGFRFVDGINDKNEKYSVCMCFDFSHTIQPRALAYHSFCEYPKAVFHIFENKIVELLPLF